MYKSTSCIGRPLIYSYRNHGINFWSQALNQVLCIMFKYHRHLCIGRPRVLVDPWFIVMKIINLWNYFLSPRVAPSHVQSSSSCRAISTDIPDPLSPLLPIVHCFLQVLRATPRILTELLYVGSSWSPCFCLAMWRGL